MTDTPVTHARAYANTNRITYNEMVGLFGKDTALKLLQCIEESASACGKIIHFDYNVRLQQALDALNDNPSVV